MPPLHAVGMGLLPACSAADRQIPSPSSYPLVFITATGVFSSRMPTGGCREVEAVFYYFPEAQLSKQVSSRHF